MKRLLLASVAVAAATGLAFAAGTAATGGPDGDGHPMKHGWGGRMEMMHGGFRHHDMFGAILARYDANGDGSITRAEIDAGIAKDFHAADANHDGKLTNDELKAYMEAQHAAMAAKMGMPQPPPKDDQPKDGPDRHWDHPGMDHMDIVKHLDWNMDGALSLEEFAAPIRLAAMRLDHDGNGTITATDLLAHGEHGPMQH